jgi:hypothetical protein
MFVLGDCYCCGQLFMFNAHRVPSITVRGTRQPICAHCIALVNPYRIANGLDPLVPLPGAYEPEDVS